jgi:ornithine cyclodeaminase
MPRADTLALGSEQIAALLDLPALVHALKDAYVRVARDRRVRPQRLVATVGESSVVVNVPGVVGGYAAFTAKINTKTPSNRARGLPFLIGTILLIDQATGVLLAVLDAGLLTAMRTGAAGALGVLALARPDASRTAVLGAGVQSDWQLRALHAVGRLREAWVFDRVPEVAKDLAERLTRDLRTPVHAAATPQAAVRDADVLVCVTPSRTPILTADLVKPGLHINAFGADEPGKVELSAELLPGARIIVDDRDLALTHGALNVAAQAGLAGPDSIAAEIGEVLSGEHPGRTASDQITVFGSVGLAFQDLVAAQIVYERARAAGLGTSIPQLHAR